MFPCRVYPKKYAQGFVVLCFVVVMHSFIINSHEVFIHIHQGCFAGTGAIVRLPQCQWSKPDGYGKISQCITTTKHSKAKTVCIFLGIYCTHIDHIYQGHPFSLGLVFVQWWTKTPKIGVIMYSLKWPCFKTPAYTKLVWTLELCSKYSKHLPCYGDLKI